MYLPKHHEECDVAALHALIEARPLGAWVTYGDGELIVNHVPFLLDRARGERGTLIGHVARANPVWKLASGSVPSIVVFQGVDAYISPSWYPSKHTHGRVVPTWNYAVVHAHGIPAVFEDRERLLQLVHRMTESQERAQAIPWSIADAPAEFIERLLGAIVGIELPITKLVGKWKVNRNSPDADKRGVVAALLAQGDLRSAEMAELVRRHVSAD